MAINHTPETSLLRKYFVHLQNNQLDIRRLVCRARSILILAKPLISIVEICQKVARWEHCWATISFLFVCNVGCLLLSPVYMTLAAMLVLFGFFGVGLSHRKHRVLAKAFPSLSKLSCNDEELDHHECMQEFHLLLVIVDDSMRRCSSVLLKFYSLLKLEDWNFSIKCYAVMFGALLFLFLFPLRFFLVLLTDFVIVHQPVRNWLAYRNRHWSSSSSAGSSPVKGEHLSPLSSSPTANNKVTTQSDDAVSQSSEFQTDPGFGTDSEGSEKLHSESSSGDEASEVGSVAGDVANQAPTQNKPDIGNKGSGVVGRLLDLKKRKQGVKERCTGCGVMFTTILKRRHICINCTNYFCSRCCSYKVPRSMFGATAPAAQTETVPVCIKCYNVLIGPDAKDKTN